MSEKLGCGGMYTRTLVSPTERLEMETLLLSPIRSFLGSGPIEGPSKSGRGKDCEFRTVRTLFTPSSSKDGMSLRIHVSFLAASGRG